MNIDLAADFSPYPSGRFQSDGSFNGERFREEVLVPALLKAKADASGVEKVAVNIDGVRSFGSSFLEEAFAGLIRTKAFTSKELTSLLEIVCTKPNLFFFRDMILDYIQEASVHQTSMHA